MTTLIPFANHTLEGDETLVQAGNRIREEINASAVVDFGFHFHPPEPPIHPALSARGHGQLGFKSFKMFMTYKKRPGRMCDDDYICEAMEMVARGGGVLQLHCESGNIIEYLENKLIADGHIHPEFFPVACPDWAEEEAINRAIAMAGATRCPTYVVHLSTQLGLERIKQAQATGQPIWTETCPQYLLLSDAEMAKVGPLAKIGPPLRPEDGPRPRRPVGRAATGTHIHRGQRPLAPSRGAEETRLGQHLRDARRSVGAIRLPGYRDTGTLDVQRGRGQARDAHHVAGPHHGGKPGPASSASTPARV